MGAASHWKRAPGSRANGSYDVSTMKCEAGCDTAGYLVHAAARLFMRSLDKELRRLNITAAQLAPLLLLSEHGSLVQRDLVKLSATAQPAMVAMLRRLEQDGLVVRTGDASDARAVRFDLTGAGRQVVRTATQMLNAVNERCLTDFKAHENASLLRSLKKMIGNLSE